jgi:hypothetical protein
MYQRCFQLFRCYCYVNLWVSDECRVLADERPCFLSKRPVSRNSLAHSLRKSSNLSAKEYGAVSF